MRVSASISATCEHEECEVACEYREEAVAGEVRWGDGEWDVAIEDESRLTRQQVDAARADLIDEAMAAGMTEGA